MKVGVIRNNKRMLKDKLGALIVI